MKGKFLGLMGLALAIAFLAGCESGGMQSATIIGSTVTSAPPEKVWNFLCSASVADWKEIAPKITVNNINGEPCMVGYSEDQTTCSLGKCYTIHSVGIDVVPMQRQQFKFAGEVNGTNTYLLAPEGSGSKMTIILEVSGRLPPGISYDMIKADLQKGIDQQLATIKAKVEKR